VRSRRREPPHEWFSMPSPWAGYTVPRLRASW